MLLAVGEHVIDDLDEPCRRMATGFAGGVGDGQQEMCGALSSGILIIGALLGRTHPNEDDRPALSMAARYRERFLATFGATQCATLRQTVIYGPGNLGSCAVLVEQAADILLELLEPYNQSL